MKGYPTITNLKDFVSLYGLHKSDAEIASLLNISLNEVQSVKEKNNRELKDKNSKKIKTIL